jgi:hypothetical protein
MRQLSKLAAVLLVACLLVLPWNFGGVFEYSLFWLSAATLLSVALFLTSEWLKSGRLPALPSLSTCLILAAGFGAFQATNLPLTVCQVLAPAATRLREEAASAYQLTSSDLASSISFVPSETWADVGRLIIAAALLAFAAGVFETSRQRWWCLAAFVVNGFAWALFGIAQRLTWNGKLYWMIDSPSGGSFASYVNRNNAAGYLLIIFFLFLGWLSQRPGKNALMLVRNGSLRQRLAALIHLDVGSLAIGMVTLLFLLAVLLTYSRGALVGLALGGLAYFLVVYRTTGRLPSVGTIAMLAMAALFVWWCRMDERVGARILSMTESAEFEGIRFLHWQDDWAMLKEVWIGGCGIGNYPIANRVFQTVELGRWFKFSENQYLEAALVGGVPGIVFSVGFLVLLGSLLRKLLRAENKATAVAAIGVMTSQLVAAFFDFGLYLAANFGLLAFVCGLFAGEARTEAAWDAARTSTGTAGARWKDRIGWAVVLVGLMGCISMFYSRGQLEREAQKYLKRSVEAGEQRRSLSEIDRSISAVEKSLQRYPSSWSGQQLLSQLWIERSQTQLYESIIDGGAASVTAWNATRLNYLFIRLVSLQEDQKAASTLLNDPAIQDNLPSALAASKRAARLNPFDGRNAIQTAVLEALLSGRHEHLMPLLELGCRWRPQSSSIHLEAAGLALSVGNRERAMEWMTDSLRLSGAAVDKHFRFAAAALSPAEFANCLDVMRPAAIVRSLLVSSNRVPIEYKASLIESVVSKLAPRVPTSDGGGDLPYLISKLTSELGDVEATIQHLRDAVEAKPSSADWRYELSRHLYDSGDKLAAIQQAKLCAKLAPSKKRYQEWLQNLERSTNASAPSQR